MKKPMKKATPPKATYQVRAVPDPLSVLTDRLLALEARVAALESGVIIVTPKAKRS